MLLNLMQFVPWLRDVIHLQSSSAFPQLVNEPPVQGPLDRGPVTDLWPATERQRRCRENWFPFFIEAVQQTREWRTLQAQALPAQEFVAA